MGRAGSEAPDGGARASPAGRRSSRRPPEGAAGPVSAAPPPRGRRPPALCLARLPGGRGGGAGRAGPQARGGGGRSRRGRASAPGIFRARRGSWAVAASLAPVGGSGAGDRLGRFSPAARLPGRAATALGGWKGGAAGIRIWSPGAVWPLRSRAGGGCAASGSPPGAEAGGTGRGEAGGGDWGACPLPCPRAPFTRPSSPALQPGASPGRALNEEEEEGKKKFFFFFFGPGGGRRPEGGR